MQYAIKFCVVLIKKYIFFAFYLLKWCKSSIESSIWLKQKPQNNLRVINQLFSLLERKMNWMLTFEQCTLRKLPKIVLSFLRIINNDLG